MTPQDLLRLHSIFGALTNVETPELMKRAVTKRVAAGEVVFRKDDPGNGLYGVLTGSILIVVESPEGKELGYIKTEVPTNVGFGRGAEAKTLYITAGKSLYRIGLNKDGYQLPAK